MPRKDILTNPESRFGGPGGLDEKDLRDPPRRSRINTKEEHTKERKNKEQLL
jgi:hypothetical protein